MSEPTMRLVAVCRCDEGVLCEMHPTGNPYVLAGCPCSSCVVAREHPVAAAIALADLNGAKARFTAAPIPPFNPSRWERWLARVRLWLAWVRA